MKRIAVITTIYRYLSHAQHFADRFLSAIRKKADGIVQI